MRTTLRDPHPLVRWLLWLVVCFLFSPQEGFGCSHDQVRIGDRCFSDPIQERIFDLIAYGIQSKSDGVVLATPVGSVFCVKVALFNRTQCYQALPWRFGVRASSGRPIEAMLSRSGTKLFLTYPNGFDIADLQDPVGGAKRQGAVPPSHEQQAVSQLSPTHRLPNQLYTLRVDGQVHVIDDCQTDRSKAPNSGSDCYDEQVAKPYPVFDAIAAAVSPSGHELLVGHDGAVSVYDPDSRQSHPLGRLPSGTEDVEVIAAPKGEEPEFLVIYRSGDHFLVAEPGSPSPLAEFSEGLPVAELRVAAQIAACLLFHGESPDLARLVAEFQARTKEPADIRAKRYGLALAPLLAGPDLHEDAARGVPSASEAASENWHVRRLRPDPALYAPVLEMASGEPVIPSSTDIWDNAKLGSPLPRGAKAQEEAWRTDWYDRLTIEERLGKAAVYYRTLSFGGTWLMEYWVYYPFDVGGVSGHLHDEEHLFVEVDKLGGRPLSVLASAHSALTPSNLYSSVDPLLAFGAPPPTLPVFAFVELGKHAMAPDIDRDGHFTFGRDVNMYRETSQVWGVRDFVGYTSAHMETFNNSMMLPRLARDQLAPSEYKTYFPLSAVRFEGSTYRLLPFPELGMASTMGGANMSPCSGQRRFSGRCGELKLQDHSDASAAWKIYKPWVYPLGEARWGYVHWTSGVQRDGLVISLFPINFGLAAFVPALAFPGRLVPEVIAAKGGGYGLSYELQATNLFGWYAGGLWRPDASPASGQGSGSPASERGWAWRAGLSVTIPSYRPGTVHVQLGPVLRSSGQSSSLGLEVRVLYNYASLRGRARFGRDTDRDSKPGFWRTAFPGEAYPGDPFWASFIAGKVGRPYSAAPEPGSN